MSFGVLLILFLSNGLTWTLVNKNVSMKEHKAKVIPTVKVVKVDYWADQNWLEGGN